MHTKIISAAFMGCALFLDIEGVLAREGEMRFCPTASQRSFDRDVAAVHSREELEQFLAIEPDWSPLHQLTRLEKTQFISSLVFSDTGLASYSIEGLKRLKIERQFQILSLFGEQQSLLAFHPDLAQSLSGCDAGEQVGVSATRRPIRPPSFWPQPGVDYPGYKCVPPATCQQSFADTICIGDRC